MIDTSKQNKTLKVCLDDAGTHNKAILDFFFAKLGQHIFVCVDSQEEANVLLLDYDYPPARKRYDEEYQHWQKPALVLSISEVTLDNAIWLAKPLTSRALLDAAETLQRQIVPTGAETNAAPVSSQTPIGVTETVTQPVLQRPPILETPPDLPSQSLVQKSTETLPSEIPPVAEVDESDSSGLHQERSEIIENLDAPAEDRTEMPSQGETPELSESEKQARIALLCGEHQDIAVNADLSDFLRDDSFFLSSLKDAIRLARQCQQGVLLNFPQARIYVLPEIHRVFCGIDIQTDEFTDLIANCSVSEGGKMHILSTNEIHELNDMISQQASALYDMEAFVWTSTLLSANGRLPRSLDPTKKVGLKHWPSLTRLENFPNVMPIAAQWSASAMSAFDVAKSLNVPQRYVFSFYNAANSLGLIEQDPEKLISKQPVPRTKDAPRGLFSRLLKKLVGG